jgi:hypothetical protein
LALSHLPAGASLQAETLGVDDDHDLAPLRRETLTPGAARLTVELPGDSVRLVRLRPAPVDTAR